MILAINTMDFNMDEPWEWLSYSERKKNERRGKDINNTSEKDGIII